MVRRANLSAAILPSKRIETHRHFPIDSHSSDRLSLQSLLDQVEIRGPLRKHDGLESWILFLINQQSGSEWGNLRIAKKKARKVNPRCLNLVLLQPSNQSM